MKCRATRDAILERLIERCGCKGVFWAVDIPLQPEYHSGRLRYGIVCRIQFATELGYAAGVLSIPNDILPQKIMELGDDLALFA